MLRFILRRLGLLVPVIAGPTAIMFAIARLLPGDPVALAAGPNATKAEIAALAAEYSLDKPLWTQYTAYVWGLAHGDLGTSLLTRRPVAADIAAYLPATLELVLTAMFVAVAVGIPLGLVTAVWRNRWPDYLAQIGAIGAISMPRFVLGLLFQLCFAMWLMWLPLGGRLPIVEIPPRAITGFLIVDSLIAGNYFGWLLGGTVLVETVFDWPGLGLYATKAIVSQDMMPVMGVALVIGILFIFANLVIDVLYGIVNPKVRYS